MKRNIINPIAAVAALALTFTGCASSDNQTGTTAMTTTTETQSVAVTDEEVDRDYYSRYETDDTDTRALGVTEPGQQEFNTRYEAETRSAGLVLTDDVAYKDMFEEIENTKSYNILSLAETSSNLSTFMELMRSTGMMSALEAEGSFTLFAPTNEAFAALPAGRLEHLMQPENRAELVDILNAHILPTKVRAAQFNSSQRITYADGRAVPITVDHNMINIGGATVVKQNIEASNGIVHVVDGVIIPSDNVGGPYGR